MRLILFTRSNVLLHLFKLVKNTYLAVGGDLYKIQKLLGATFTFAYRALCLLGICVCKFTAELSFSFLRNYCCGLDRVLLFDTESFSRIYLKLVFKRLAQLESV